MKYFEKENIGKPIFGEPIQTIYLVILVIVNAIRLRLPCCKKEEKEVTLLAKREEREPTTFIEISYDGVGATPIFPLLREHGEATTTKAYFLIFYLKREKIELKVDRQVFEEKEVGKNFFREVY